MEYIHMTQQCCLIAAEIRAFGACYQRVSTAIVSMFHDTCQKWQSDSGPCSRLCRRVIGHSWRDGGAEGIWKNSSLKKKRWAFWGGWGLRMTAATRSLLAGSTPLVFIRPSCTAFLSICTNSYSKCLSWSDASSANWQIVINVFWYGSWRGSVQRCTHPLNLSGDGIFIWLISQPRIVFASQEWDENGE